MIIKVITNLDMGRPLLFLFADPFDCLFLISDPIGFIIVVQRPVLKIQESAPPLGEHSSLIITTTLA